jgi:hypothetical protein
MRRAEEAILAGMLISLRRMVAVVARVRPALARGRGGAGEVEGDDGQDQPGRVRCESARRHAGQGAALQVGVDELDGRMGAVSLSAGPWSRVLVVKNAWKRWRPKSVSRSGSFFVFSSGTTLSWAAGLVGVEVPLNLVFFVSIGILFLVCLQHSAELTKLEAKTRTLAEIVAIQDLRLRQLEELILSEEE